MTPEAAASARPQIAPRLRVVQAVFGVFHHFALAHQLHQRGVLQRIYSTFPWQRLKREGLPRERVSTFPWIHTPEFVLARTGHLPLWLNDELGLWNARLFDEWTLRTLPACDVLIAISGAALRTGRQLQQRGGWYVCDRGSTHIRYQNELVTEEFARWGWPRPACDPRDIAREEEQYALADAITLPSTHAARSFVAMGLPAEKLRVIPYGMSLTSFYPEGTPSPQSFDVLFVGAVDLRKGIPYLLEAFARLQHPKKRLRIVGDVKENLREVLRRLPQEQVEFLGRRNRDQVRRLMSESHLMVLPSVEEGLALVQGEALACGCPVLATVHTGSEDLFIDGVEGFIVPVRDVASLAERMQQLADDPPLREQMSQAALRRAQALGGWSTYGDRWMEFLAELTAARSPR
ncbi:MAG: glycosyltransferase family 4 protein [Acidobacteriota bacterium]|nr:glycosyltransferase family 4 protein [Acidobacteriota bacterium]